MPFLTSYVPPPEIYFCKFIKIFFVILHRILYHVIYGWIKVTVPMKKKKRLMKGFSVSIQALTQKTFDVVPLKAVYI